MPVPAVIVPVCTMGMAREGTCRLEQMLPKKVVAMQAAVKVWGGMEGECFQQEAQGIDQC